MIIGDMVDSGSSSERNGYFEIFTSTLISFIFQCKFAFKGYIKHGHEVTK